MNIKVVSSTEIQVILHLFTQRSRNKGKEKEKENRKTGKQEKKEKERKEIPSCHRRTLQGQFFVRCYQINQRLKSTTNEEGEGEENGKERKRKQKEKETFGDKNTGDDDIT